VSPENEYELLGALKLLSVGMIEPYAASQFLYWSAADAYVPKELARITTTKRVNKTFEMRFCIKIPPEIILVNQT
jgi:hypothetical protein